MAIKIKKNGVVQDLVINANEVRVLDTDGNFRSKNLESVLKELNATGDHNHDDRYYTENEIDTLLSQKADKSSSLTNSTGTFTPNLVISDGKYIPMATNSLQRGAYMVIGNLCFVNIEINGTYDNSKYKRYPAYVELPFATGGVCTLNITTATDNLTAPVSAQTYRNRLILLNSINYNTHTLGDLSDEQYLVIYATGFYFIE